MDFNELKKRRIMLELENEKITSNIDSSLISLENNISTLCSLRNETNRVLEITKNSNKILLDLETEFEKQTGLNKVDITFLLFATALQCIRQYLITDFKERLDNKEADRKIKGNTEESTDRTHRYYKPSLEQVINNPVPYDVMFGSKDFNLSLSGKNHRAKTLGHDPLLGWIFGTANIATSTLTNTNFESFHIKTGFTANDIKRDKISYNANTLKVLSYTFNKLFKEELEGKKIIGTSLLKQGIHLQSDVITKKSLPIPLISSFSSELANEIVDYGLDFANIANVGKQSSYTIGINLLIAMLHKLSYDESQISKKLFSIKTNKILNYSNLIASSSNLLYGACSRDLKKIDIGGYLVTLYRLYNDIEFSYKIKEEFIFNHFNDLIKNDI